MDQDTYDRLTPSTHPLITKEQALDLLVEMLSDTLDVNEEYTFTANPDTKRSLIFWEIEQFNQGSREWDYIYGGSFIPDEISEAIARMNRTLQ